MVLVVLLLFRAQVAGQATFIGDHDRLATYLNALRDQATSLQSGRLSTWSELRGLGEDAFAFPPAQPSPVTLVAALFPPGAIYAVDGWIVSGELALAGLAFVVFARGTGVGPFAAFVGAAAYETSSTLLINAAQYDAALAIFVVSPLVLALLRALPRAASSGPLLGLVVLLSLLLGTTSLLFVYALPLFGAYAAYRAWVARSWSPVLLFAAAFGLALLVASPRLIGFAQTVQTSARDAPIPRGDFEAYYNYHNIRPREFLRFFEDRVFGNYQGQAVEMGNNISLHEGLRLYGSTFVALLAVLALVRYNRRWFGLFTSLGDDALFHAGCVVAVLCLVLVKPVVFLMFALSGGADYIHNRVALAGILSLCMLAALQGDRIGASTLGRSRRGLALVAAASVLALAATAAVEQLATRSGESKFALSDSPIELLKVTGELAVAGRVTSAPEPPRTITTRHLTPTLVEISWTAVPDASDYRLEMQRGVAGAFESLGSASAGRTRYDVGDLSPDGAYGFRVQACRQEQCSAFSEVSIVNPDPVPHSPSADDTSTGTTWVLSTAWLRLVYSTLLFGLILVVLTAFRSAASRAACALLLGWLVVFQAFAYADFELNGPQDFDQQSLFVNGFLNARPGELQVPDAAQLAAIRERLQTDQYRTVLLCDQRTLPALCGNHVSSFWKVRTVAAYSFAVPDRLDRLPWPSTARGYRALIFTAQDPVPWPLLAFTNVRYAATVTRPFFLNTAFEPDQLEVQENPLPVVPRAYFPEVVESVSGVDAAVGRLFPPGSSEPALDVTQTSLVEGAAGADQHGIDTSLDAQFDGDVVNLRVNPAPGPRIVVLNEAYDSHWRASADGQDVPIYPANVDMRAVLVPANATTVQLRFVPFVSSLPALVLTATGLCLLGLTLALMNVHGWKLRIASNTRSWAWPSNAR